MTYSGQPTTVVTPATCGISRTNKTYAPSLNPALFGLGAGYCIDASAVLLIPPEAGGTFSGPGVLFFPVDGFYYFDPGGAGVGTHLITWGYCGITQKTSVSVYPLPTVTLLPPTVDVDPVATPFYTLVGGDPAGGYYTVDGVITTVIDTNAIAKGAHEVKYFYTDGFGCGSNATQTLTILEVGDYIIDSDGSYLIDSDGSFLIDAAVFSVTAASFTVTGVDVSLVGGGMISVRKRKYKVTTVPVNFSSSGALQIDTATYTVTTQDVGLLGSGSTRNYIDVLFPEYTVTRVTYTGALLMDIYEPVGDTSTSEPFVVVCCAGDSEFDAFQPAKICKALVKRGYRAASIQYNQSVSFKDETFCFWRATRYLKANAATYGGNPAKVLGYGISRGGFTAWQAGIAWNNSGDAYFSDPMNLEDAGFTNEILGTGSQSSAANDVYLNNYLAAGDAPHFSWHGDEDETVPLEWDQDAIEAMQALGITAILTILEGEAHGLNFDDVEDDLVGYFASLV